MSKEVLVERQKTHTFRSKVTNRELDSIKLAHEGAGYQKTYRPREKTCLVLGKHISSLRAERKEGARAMERRRE